MTNPKRLHRSDDDRWIGGVCGGLSEYTGVDAGLIRLLVAVGTILGFGSLILAYVAAWVIIPKEDSRPIPPMNQPPTPPTPPAPAPPSE
ncbi:PspC domain-containing protein [Aeromicrobium sp.]|uniref:PspC domain-containing protein n=1 Tax=Aeromicrobium sp. TaxID=1871063 RepID=UPI003D6A2225